MGYNETPTKGFTMNSNQKIVVAATVTAVAAPALIVLGRKVAMRIKSVRTANNETVTSSN
jgi:hypothetical protein